MGVHKYKNECDLITYTSLICSPNLSTITKKRLSKLERSKLTIENPLNEIIIGLLLGDGHIQKRSVTGNSRFMYGQSSLRIQHLNYFNHVLELFKPYLSKDFNLKTRSFINKKTNIIYIFIILFTILICNVFSVYFMNELYNNLDIFCIDHFNFKK